MILRTFEMLHQVGVGAAADLVADIKDLHPAGSYLWYGGDLTAGSWTDQIQSSVLAEATNPPTVATDAGIGGETCGVFAGSEFLDHAAKVTAIAQPYTLFFVVKMTDVSPAAAERYFDRIAGGIATGAFQRTAGNMRATAGTNLSSTAFATLGIADGAWFRYAFVANGASSELWFNGTKDVTGNAGTNSIDSITLGALSGGGSQNLNGSIAWFSIYNGDADADGNLVTIFTKLATIYGL